MIACDNSKTPSIPVDVVTPVATAIPTAITSPTSPTATATITNTPLPTYTLTSTPTLIYTYTYTFTPTNTPTKTITNTPTITLTSTNTSTNTITSTPTNTPTITSTPTSIYHYVTEWTVNAPSGAACSSASIYIAENASINAFSFTGTSPQSWSVPTPASGLSSGLAVDGNGNVYMADSYNNLIREYTSSGTPVTTYGPGTLKQPSAVAVDSSGSSGISIYVADSGNNQIQKFSVQIATPTTGPVTTVTETAWGSNGSLSFPEGIAASTTNVYVADTLNNEVASFDTNGNNLSKWGGPGSGDLQFVTPIGIAYNGSTSLLFVADYGNNRVEVLSTTGIYSNQFGSSSSAGGNGILKGPEGVAVGGGYIFVADTNDNLIQVFQ